MAWLISRIAPFVVLILSKTSWGALTTWWERRVVTGKIPRLPTVVTFYPKIGNINLVSGVDKVVVVPRVAALGGDMIGTVANSAICAVVLERRV